MFQYIRDIHVYETDLMGIVHHGNYLRLCEEARVAWCKHHGLLNSSKQSIFKFTVYETFVRHLAPARYGDQMIIDLQVRVKKAKLIFEYRMQTQGKIVAVAETVHCSLSEEFKILRLDETILETVRKESWTETWL